MARNRAVRRAREEALKKLEQDIAAGRKTVSKNARGEVEIKGWAQTAAAQAGVCEGCALVKLSQSKKYSVRAKLASLGVKKGKEFVAASHNGHGHKV
jgi:hypothetical protein